MSLVFGSQLRGRDDAFVRVGQCASCGVAAQLRSYTARKYLVLLWLPLVPLGTYRILAQCSSCRREQVVQLEDWLKARAERLESCSLKLAGPSACGADVHEFLQAVCEFHAADVFRSQLARVNALVAAADKDTAEDLMANLGAAYSHFRSFSKADACLRQGLLACPGSQRLACELALSLMQRERPSEAEALLEPFLDVSPHAVQAYFYVLVEAYQVVGKHREAERVLQKVAATAHGQVRSEEHQGYVARVAAYVGSGQRIPSLFLGIQRPPTRDLSLRFALAGLSLLLAGGYVGCAAYLGAETPVYLVNGLPQPYDVEVEGRTYHLAAHSAQAIELRQGTVQFKSMTAGVSANGQVSMRTAFWTRPFDSTLFVLNPDQVALMASIRIPYSASAGGSGGEPVRVFLGGESFYQLEGVDYPFHDFPKEISVSTGAPDVFKTALQMAPADVKLERVLELLKGNGSDSVRRYLLARLQNDATVSTLAFATRQLSAEVMLPVIKPHLEDSPVNVVWHREYQNLSARSVAGGVIAAEYRARLARSPNDPALQYLLARTLDDSPEATNLVEGSTQGEHPCPFGILYLARNAMSRGDALEAEKLTARALQLAPELALLVQETRREALEALGRWKELLSDTELRTEDRLCVLVEEGGPRRLKPSLPGYTTRWVSDVSWAMPGATWWLQQEPIGRPVPGMPIWPTARRVTLPGLSSIRLLLTPLRSWAGGSGSVSMWWPGSPMERLTPRSRKRSSVSRPWPFAIPPIVRPTPDWLVSSIFTAGFRIGRFGRSWGQSQRVRQPLTLG